MASCGSTTDVEPLPANHHISIAKDSRKAVEASKKASSNTLNTIKKPKR
ncbi:hypothetical protein [Candidatus Liberibacter solanacearum]